MSKIEIHNTAYNLVSEIINSGMAEYHELFDVMTSDCEPADEEVVLIAIRRKKKSPSRGNIFAVASESDRNDACI